MHLVDTTMFFCARSGGVKRYLLAKHAWFQQHLHGIRHSMLVPSSAGLAPGAIVCSAAALPLVDGYRFPINRTQWRDELIRLHPDLIEAGDPYIPGWAARDAASRLGVPAVAFCHSDVPRLLSQRVGGWIKPVAGKFLRNFFAGFDLVLAPSRCLVQTLSEIGVRRVQHQPLGVDIKIFSPQCRHMDLRHELGLKESTRLLVYAGRFAKEKNLHVLIEAVDLLGDPYHLLLVGGRRRQAHSRRVTIWPYQRNAEKLATLLASCDAFVHAGECETFGLILAEAMACGIPAVAVRSGGVPEVLTENEGMLVRGANASEFVNGIASLFDRDCATLGLAARSRAERLFSWDAAFMPLAGNYFQLTGKRREVAWLAPYELERLTE